MFFSGFIITLTSAPALPYRPMPTVLGCKQQELTALRFSGFTYFLANMFFSRFIGTLTSAPALPYRPMPTVLGCKYMEFVALQFSRCLYCLTNMCFFSCIVTLTSAPALPYRAGAQVREDCGVALVGVYSCFRRKLFDQVFCHACLQFRIPLHAYAYFPWGASMWSLCCAS